MKHTILAKYPVSAAAVLKMFSNKEFHTRKLDSMGYKYRVLDSKAAGKEFSISIERKVPMDAPALIKKLIPAETTVVNEESWNAAAKTGRVKVMPKGVPVEVSCTATLKDEAGGCVINYSWDISARVPLVGGALEKFVAGDMDRRLADETAAAVKLAKEFG
jgi:hypothetical protein